MPQLCCKRFKHFVKAILNLTLGKSDGDGSLYKVWQYLFLKRNEVFTDV